MLLLVPPTEQATMFNRNIHVRSQESPRAAASPWSCPELPLVAQFFQPFKGVVMPAASSTELLKGPTDDAGLVGDFGANQTVAVEYHSLKLGFLIRLIFPLVSRMMRNAQM